MISVAIDCRIFRIPINSQDCTVVKIDTLTPTVLYLLLGCVIIMILNEHIGSYSQTLRINMRGGDNEVEVRREGKVLYNGMATHIIDKGNKLQFKDAEGKQHEYIKYSTVCWA